MNIFKMSSKLTDEHILNELNAISDSMALNSDEGGDSDAEDDILYPSLVDSRQTNSSEKNSFWSLKTRSSDIMSDNNYCIDNEKEKLTENSTNVIINSFNECEEKQSLSNDLSIDDEDIDDTDKDKDYTPTVLECNESPEDFPLDLDLFLNDENILNDDDIIDNPPNISDFNFEKAGYSPEIYKLTRFREVHGSGNKNIYKMCPIQIFDMIMGNIMYQKIVFESNLFAEQNNILLNTNIESFILYKESCNTMNKKYINQLEFRSRLTDELISNFSSRKKQTSSPQDSYKKKN
ncbi:uncharacterized protein LOC132952217 isoform X2 [Metopolophium dirhodum]|uniref:uncharacterized protein LOC132952217 isoform X2 n=1 Tax=Metopolophium dirhodum TaxID=44670 RepID=UPI0029901D4D|nr:uncharacterized protein LOC132952217 isoform X2 [Metopolophium dirhodum]